LSPKREIISPLLSGIIIFLLLLVTRNKEPLVDLVVSAIAAVAVAFVLPISVFIGSALTANSRIAREELVKLGPMISDMSEQLRDLSTRQAQLDGHEELGGHITPMFTRIPQPLAAPNLSAVLPLVLSDVSYNLGLVKPAVRSGRYWKMTQGRLKDEEWKRHRDVLAEVLGEAFAVVDGAFTHAERITTVRSLRAIGLRGNQVKPVDELPELAESLASAEKALRDCLGSLPAGR
jgi:hypothetical protein